ncbi:embryo defective, eukaryotic translation initiation factor [Salix suchowensis]|nr:embryo defective, eukaryotic translation initiation factor [Salix suchowensis]
MASGGIVNIRRDVDDKFYRYRMPLLTTKIEGKGNGIKTVVPNMSDVARALSRPPTYTTKFFGCELGAQTSFDEKNDRYIVNGAHDANRLRELLDVFIDKFVLCKACKNPETELVILKVGRSEDIIRDCKACGERTGIDMRHKLTTFILKNPPVKSKKSKKGGAGGGAADGVGGVAALALGGGDDDGSDEDVNSPYSQLGRWITENHDDDAKAFSIAIYKKAEEFGIEKKHKTVLVIVQALFDADIVTQIPKYAALLAKVCNPHGALLRNYLIYTGVLLDGDIGEASEGTAWGVERLVGISHPELIALGVPKILMALYQIDVLDEEVITQWGHMLAKSMSTKTLVKRSERPASLSSSRTDMKTIFSGSRRLTTTMTMTSRRRQVDMYVSYIRLSSESPLFRNVFGTYNHSQRHTEPSPKRVRVLFGGTYIVDTRKAKLVWEKPFYPTYFFPHDALDTKYLQEGSSSSYSGKIYDIVVGDRRAEGVVTKYFQTDGEDGKLAGLLKITFGAMDAWFEEDEQVFVHPKDPYKGTANYYHVRAGQELAKDIVWWYQSPILEVAAIKGYVAFYDEKVDVWVDGEKQERPVSHFV